MKNHQLIVICVSILGTVMYLISDSAIQVMYPAISSAENFRSFFGSTCLIGFLAGFLLPIKSLKNFWLSASISLFFVLVIVSTVCGLVFSFSTKTDEFLLYFASAQASFFVLVFGLGLLLKFFIKEAKLDPAVSYKSVIHALITVFVIKSFFPILSVQIVWFFVLTLAVFLLYLTRRTEAPVLS